MIILVPSTPTVTIGQIKPWTINIGITNKSSRTIQFKKANLTFNSNTNDVSSEFTYQHGDTLANGQKYLPELTVDIKDQANNKVARVIKTLYVRKKDRQNKQSLT